MDSSTNQTAKRLPDPMVSSGAFGIFFIVTMLLAIMLLLAPKAQAANRNWNNTGGTDWNTGTNWSGNQVPVAGDTATFGAAKVSNPNLSAAGNIDHVNFSTITSSGYDITSSSTSITLTLTGTGTTTTSAISGVNTSGTNTFDAPIVLGAAAAATQTFTQASGGTLVVNGIISSTNTLTLDLAGTGTVQFSGANTYAGATTVSAGVLNIRNNTALGTTANGTSVTGGAALELQGTTIAVGAEALTLNGTGISSGGALRNISGNNSYAGLITLGSATRINSDSGTLTIDVASGNAITGTQNLTFGGAGNVTVNDPIATSTGTLTKDGAGTLTLSGTNTYTGLTNITAGTLAEGVSNAISTGDVTVNGATAIFNLGTNHTDTVGTVTLAGGGNINGTGTSALTSTGTFEMQSGTVNAILAGAGIQLNKTTSGTVTLNNANTYTGLTNITAGTLAEGVSNAISTGAVTVNGATAVFDLGANHTDSVGIVTLDGGGSITGTGTSALTSTGTFEMKSGTASAILAGSGIALNKTTAGTVTLTGANTYTGGTAVSAGTLFVNNSTGSGTGTAAVVVSNSGTLGGSGMISGAVTLNNSAVINAGGTAGAIGTLTTGALTLNNTSILSVDMTSTTADKISVIGGISLATTSVLQLNIPNGTTFAAGQVFTLLDNDAADAISGTFSNAPTGTDIINGYAWVVTYGGGTGNDFVLTAVPEPSTWAAGVLAFASLILFQRGRITRFLKRRP